MSANPLKLAFYGDDFTGATDTLATLSTAGLKTMLFMGLPSAEQLAAAGALDCLGIAGAARSMGNAEQRSELQRVGRFFSELRVPVVHYKTCSTFDSAPEAGSIGVAVRTLREQLQSTGFTAFVGGQPNLGRYCVFGNLFAAFKRGGRAYRLDRHPTMSQHPVTPMHEADLRLHLAEQGLKSVGLVEYPDYDLPADEFKCVLEQQVSVHADGVLFDVGHTSHLSRVGEMIWKAAGLQPMLAVGPSSVAQALIAYWGAAGELGSDSESVVGSSVVSSRFEVPADESKGSSVDGRDATQNPDSGPVFVFSGSRSPVTANQLEIAKSYLKVALSPDVLINVHDGAYREALDAVISALARGEHVLAYVTEVAASRYVSSVALANACAAFVARVLSTAKPRRVGVAGGDTSSYTVQALNAWGLSYLGQLDPGVALCRLHSDDRYLNGVEIMLKGGQMGSADIFEQLICIPTTKLQQHLMSSGTS